MIGPAGRINREQVRSQVSIRFRIRVEKAILLPPAPATGSPAPGGRHVVGQPESSAHPPAADREFARHLPSGARDASLRVMVEPVSIASYREDTLWAVVASIGRTTRVAEVFTSRLAALADQAWREQQVKAYANFLRNSRQPTPSYTVKPIRRADLPRSWRPLPALGFLQGKLM